MADHILLIEDNAKLSTFIAGELELEGYTVTIAAHGMDGLTLVRNQPFQLLIVDWMLPGISGVEVCSQLRNTGVEVPIILLTAKDEVSDRVAGLNAGADDYVTKPFSIEELLARVKAQLRRSHATESDLLTFADLSLNRLTREVYRAQQAIELTAREFDLLELLLRHPRQVLTRDQILEQVWGFDFMGESNIIEVYVRALRIKLEVHNPQRLIHTVRGVGYVLRS